MNTQPHDVTRERRTALRRAFVHPSSHLISGIVLLCSGIAILIGNRMSGQFDPELATLAGTLPIVYVLIAIGWWMPQAGKQFDKEH